MMNASTSAPGTPADTDTCDVFQSDVDRVARVRDALVPGRVLAALAETFKILGDPTRVRLLDALSKAELCVCDLASLLGLSESAVSHQLRLLRGSRVVRARRDGRMVFYSLDDQHVLSLFQQGLRHVEEASPGPPRQASRSFELTLGADLPTSPGPAEEGSGPDLPPRGAWE